MHDALFLLLRVLIILLAILYAPHRLQVSIVYHNLASPEINLVADPCEILLILGKNILEPGLELVHGVVSCLLELVGRVSPLVKLVGVEVELVLVFWLSWTKP